MRRKQPPISDEEITDLRNHWQGGGCECLNDADALRVLDRLASAEAERDKLLAAVWRMRIIAESGSMNDPVWLMPNRIIQAVAVALGSNYTRAQELAAAEMTTVRALHPSASDTTCA